MTQKSRPKVLVFLHLNPNRSLVTAHAVAGAMHHDHVPIHRLGIRKFLSRAAQEVKPPASTPAGKPRVPAREPARPPRMGSHPQPCPSYSPFLLVPLHASKSIATPTAQPLHPTTSHHKLKKIKTFSLVSCRHVPNRVARCAHNPALQKNQPPGRLQAQ